MSQCEWLVGAGQRRHRCPETAVLRVVTPAPRPRSNCFDYCRDHCAELVMMLALAHRQVLVMAIEADEREVCRTDERRVAALWLG